MLGEALKFGAPLTLMGKCGVWRSETDRPAPKRLRPPPSPKLRAAAGEPPRSDARTARTQESPASGDCRLPSNLSPNDTRRRILTVERWFGRGGLLNGRGARCPTATH
jgi:hypothetical protein